MNEQAQVVLKMLEAFGPAPLVIYHGPCADGFCGAWLAKKRWPDAELFEGKYGEDLQNPPIEKAVGRDVLLVDYCYPHTWIPVLDDNGNPRIFNGKPLRAINPHGPLARLASGAKSLVILDHHAKNQEDIETMPGGFYDVGRSGAGLALDFLFPESRLRVENHKEYVRRRMVAGDYQNTSTTIGGATVTGRVMRDPPHLALPTHETLLVLHVEDRDLWLFKRPLTKAVSAFLATLPQTIEAWNNLVLGPNSSMNEMAQAGTAVLSYQQALVDRIAKHAVEIEWAEGKILAVNSPVLQSEVGEFLVSKAPAPLKTVMIYHQDEKGLTRCSLRSATDGADVNMMAQARGGGGHAHAAGFATNRRVVPLHDDTTLWVPHLGIS